jgi:RimJ/RimL family protein N-acetyltransferase
VIDVALAWQTERLRIEPTTVAHAPELAPLLDDAALHEFIGGAPLDQAGLTERYARWQTRRSPDGSQVWGNWVLRLRSTDEPIGTLQASLPSAGPAGGPAEIAWVVFRAAQGNGYASEAATSLADRLRTAGFTVIAHIHPNHLASQRVARAAGLIATDVVSDGEVRWTTA